MSSAVVAMRRRAGSRFPSIAATVAVTIAIGATALGPHIPIPGGSPAANQGNLWVDTNGGTCTRSASPVDYVDAAACSSLQSAFTAASAGDTVKVKGGAYGAETVTGDKGSSSHVVFEAADGELPDFIGKVTLSDLHHVTMRGFKFRTESSPGAGVATDFRDLFFEACNSDLVVDQAVDSRKWLIIEGNSDITISNGDWGDYDASTLLSGDTSDSQIGASGATGPTRSCGGSTAPPSSNILITGNTFHDVFYGGACSTPSDGCDEWDGAHPDCLQTDGYFDGLTISKNVFYNCGNTFFLFTPFQGNGYDLVMEQNVFYNLGDASFYGIQITDGSPSYKCGDVVFRYNAYDPANTSGLDPNSPIRIDCTPASGHSNARVEGNIFHKGPSSCSTHAAWDFNAFRGTVCGSDTTLLSGDPYVNSAAHDYHLTAGSEAIDAGNPAYFPSLDYDGDARYAGAAPDAGIDEKG